jgi:hypothetical protein
MNRFTKLSLVLTIPAFACAACGSNGSPSQSSPAPEGSSDGEIASDGGAVTSDAGPVTSDGGSDSSSGDASAITSIVMPRISGGVPAFASGSQNYATAPTKANDDQFSTAWTPDKLPGWIAYDLSSVPVAERQGVLVVWNALHAGDYLNATPPTGAQMPTAYTIETNAAPGGATAPTSGWVEVANVTSNLRNTVEHPVALNGGNWVRMRITGSTDALVSIDLDVFATPNGASDCWMFMGDSITHITMGYGFSNLPQLVHQARADRWPAVINAAIGGTSTVDAVAAIDQTLTGYPGRYVVLAYGTNDHVNTFQMETLVQKVLAAKKIPVIPHMPWSDAPTIQTNGPLINAAIDALYAKYPEIVRGPDLWAAFMNRTDLIPSGDVHPNSAGQVVLRQQWAQVMAAIP